MSSYVSFLKIKFNFLLIIFKTIILWFQSMLIEKYYYKEVKRL